MLTMWCTARTALTFPSQLNTAAVLHVGSSMWNMPRGQTPSVIEGPPPLYPCFHVYQNTMKWLGGSGITCHHQAH